MAKITAKLTDKGDLDKPTVEVVGTELSADEAAAKWRDAAVLHATRAETLRAGLTGIVDQIRELLAADSRKITEQDKED